MGQIREAIDALPNATPGPWEMGENVRGFYHIWGKEHKWVGQIHALPEKAHNDATIISAAPEAIAWIQEALPWLEWLNSFVDEDTKDIDKLDALIARAK